MNELLALRDFLSARIEAKRKTVASGGCTDFADYRAQTSRIKGLEDAIDEINRMLHAEET